MTVSLRKIATLLLLSLNAHAADDSHMHHAHQNPSSCVALWLEGDREVRAEERVALRLKVKNTCDWPTEVFLGGRPAHDFIVTRPDGAPVWHWLHGKTIQEVLGYRVLTPGQEIEFAGEWDQRDSEGRRVPAGTYGIIGLLKGDPPEVLKTGPLFLTIVP